MNEINDKLTRLVDDYYRNSPDWPLPGVTDLGREVQEFMADGGEFDRRDVARAIDAFWTKEWAAREHAAA